MASRNGRSSKKRDRIISAALSTFLEYGYGSTTIDKIVEKAGGSKATIYNFFKNKAKLFSTVIDELVKHGQLVESLEMKGKPEKVLLNFAISRLKVIFNEKHTLLRRVVIGESSRFPGIAKMYYRHGPEYSHKQLVKYLSEQDMQGKLKIDDSDLAADLFQGMLVHSIYLKSLYSITSSLSDSSLKKRARVVVNKFIKLYRD